MIFKLVFKILSLSRFILPMILLALAGWTVYTNFSTIKSSPIALFFPAIKQVTLPARLFGQLQSSPTPLPTEFPKQLPVHIATQKGNITYSAETASTQEEITLGLMYRTSLAAYNGMLFFFKADAQYGFWMKNCEIPLDMLFISSDKTIVDLKENVPTCSKVDPSQNNCPSYISKYPYRYVLEINAGSAKLNGIAIGNKVTF